MISIGSKWRHMEGREATIDAIGDDWVEPHDCGRWPLSEFEKTWTQTYEPPPLPPEMQWDFTDRDGTEGAHPAWWRGHAKGKSELCAALLRTIRTDDVLQIDGIDPEQMLFSDLEKLRDEFYARTAELIHSQRLVRQLGKVK